ncbi:hypothetical protein OESDEN_02355 [Oesophagostomum dentatum]|uniref:Uncharacterized protein n=1 Tax=Oesophagostomum dentatum TaxID=61180 RepID=A0A0B1TKC6_OESDE|nr:hypothetical protein OESDEN_02355 [Oesophagostomum dentatum]
MKRWKSSLTDRHHGAQEKSYQIGESVWVRDYRPDHETWIPARVTKRLGRAVYDLLTEESHIWRRHANQMRTNVEDYVSSQRYDDSGLPFPEEDQRSYSEAKKINNDCTAEDQVAIPAESSPRTTRPARLRRPPRRLQIDPRMETVLDHRPDHEAWIPARLTKRLGRAADDVLTEESHLWRRHANQMRTNVEDYVSSQRYDDSGLPFPEEDQRNYSEAKKINDDCTAEDQVAVPAEPSPRTTRPAQLRRPPDDYKSIQG